MYSHYLSYLALHCSVVILFFCSYFKCLTDQLQLSFITDDNITGQPRCLYKLLNISPSAPYVHKITSHLLAKPSVCTLMDHRAFDYAAAQIWNAIPLNIHILPSVSSFKCNLKTYYFAAAF